MNAFFSGIGVVVGLELKQRVRSVAWYVLLGVSALLLLIVTVLLAISYGITQTDDFGASVFSVLIFFVLLLGTLVTPAVSGSAVNGERDSGTLATTQVTQITAAQLVLGKLLASWIAALAFLAVAVPFLLAAVLIGGVSFSSVLVSLPVLAVELGVVAALGVGLSALLQRGIFSIVLTYLSVAVLSVGTLIGFGLGSLVSQTEVTQRSIDIDWERTEYDDMTGEIDGEVVCLPEQEYTSYQPRVDRVWWLLAANPYVVLADAVPPSFDEDGNGVDLFTGLATGVRSMQQPPETLHDFCSGVTNVYEGGFPTMEQQYEGSVPSWFVGLAIHVLLAAAAIVAAVRSLRTPSSRLAKGSRIA